MQVIKFHNGKRTQIIEKMTSNSMDFPQIEFCTSDGFKQDVLKRMGLMENSLRLGQFITYEENLELKDINDIWDNATYSLDEFVLTWLSIEGVP